MVADKKPNIGEYSDAVAERLQSSLGRLLRRTFNRRFVTAASLPEWERKGWQRTGAVEPGPLGTELLEITLEDTDLG